MSEIRQFYVDIESILKKGRAKNDINIILIIMFKELNTDVALPIKLFGIWLNKYVVLKILTPAFVIPRTKFPIKKISKDL